MNITANYAKTLLVLVSLVSACHLFSQSTLSGTVIDSSTQAPLQGVNIYFEGIGKGTITDHQGSFKLFAGEGEYSMAISALGYINALKTISISPESGDLDLGLIKLVPDIIGLKEIKIIASSTVDRSSPVAVSTIKSEIIERYVGDQPYPESMKMVPGVYATRTGGGTGDAAVNIRGFKQENVSLLLNGIPINSVENGLVYWNNWQGLTDVTRQIQVQRGLGISNVALNSVGGTINIITKTTEAEKGGAFKFDITTYGNYKATFSYSTGRMKNGLAITFLGSHFKGPGWADATYVDGWGYFLSISKEINKKHTLIFTVLGNPERHGQRNFKLSNEETNKFGLKYNKDWGSFNGEIKSASENFYHKPHFSINHYWDINENNFLATSGYVSFGNGGGTWTETFGDNPWIFSYYNPSGQIDWETIYELNQTNTDTFRLADGTDTTGFSVNIQTDFLASHVWTGVLSTLHHSFSERLKLMTGIHARYFKSRLQQKVSDLLGGGFFIDDYAYAVDGVAGRDQVKNRGDIVKVDNGAMVNFISGYAQLEYTDQVITAFLSGTINNTWYRRDDRYNYIHDIYSETISKPGFDLKAGINYNLNEHHNFYLNSGYFSRAPYYKFVFPGYNNIPTQNLENEKVISVELGYGLTLKNTRIRANLYVTKWMDKSIITNEYNQFEDPSMVNGLNALHQGFEIEISQGIGRNIQLGAFLSWGDWKWKNNVTAFLLNNENVVVDTIRVFADGLFVGDAPQTQIGLTVRFRILRLFDLTGNWIYNDRLYADFSPTTRIDPDDKNQSFRIPSYNTLDIHLGMPFNVGTLDLYGNISCLNILNSNHIIRGEDGLNHNLEDFRGFWGFGRTFNFSLKLIF